jgi:4-amino-4-deoxy-L-arabinose transferase-like glycosyltransferase
MTRAGANSFFAAAYNRTVNGIAAIDPPSPASRFCHNSGAAHCYNRPLSSNHTPSRKTAAITMTLAQPNDSRRWYLVLLAIFVAVWFYNLGSRALLDPDEARYAEIPREMVVSGDWITPRLNDLKYFEKPVLQYWATAVAYKIFGVNEFAARLWCGLTGILGVLFAGFAASRLYGRNEGILAASFLGCSLFWMALGHLNTLDMSVSFFLEAAILSFLLAQHAPLKSNQERNWMLAAWLAAALAFLTKGVIALALPAMTLVAYSLIEREFSAWKRLHFFKGLLLFAAVSAPWLIAVSIANPEFPHFFFIREHVQRFLTDEHQRVEPWWYFIPYLLIGCLPWVSLAIASIRSQWRFDKLEANSGFRGRRFLLWWIVCVVLFFSVSHSKLAPYILPVIPAVALLAANYAVKIAPALLQRHLIPLLVVWIAVIGYLLIAPTPTRRDASAQLMNTLVYWVIAAAAIAASATAIGLWLSKRQQTLNALLAMCFGTFIAISALLVGLDHMRALRSNYDLVQQVKAKTDPTKPVYAVDNYHQTLNFYLQRPVTLVGYRGELDFGLTQEPQKGIADITAFVTQWQSDPTGTVAFVRAEQFETIHPLIPLQLIGHNIHYVVIRKP